MGDRLEDRNSSYFNTLENRQDISEKCAKRAHIRTGAPPFLGKSASGRLRFKLQWWFPGGAGKSMRSATPEPALVALGGAAHFGPPENGRKPRLRRFGSCSMGIARLREKNN